jgi:enamine deaminase RidA (YjgF/YER057c/UK114 family)
MAEIKIFNPAGLAQPAATYSHVARAKTEDLVFIAGQVPTDGG